MDESEQAAARVRQLMSSLTTSVPDMTSCTLMEDGIILDNSTLNNLLVTLITRQDVGDPSVIA